MIPTYWMQITNVLWRNHFVFQSLCISKKVSFPKYLWEYLVPLRMHQKIVKNFINILVFNRSFEHFWSFGRTWKLIEKQIVSLRTAIVSFVINQIRGFIDYCACWFEFNLQSKGRFLGECYCAIFKTIIHFDQTFRSVS